MKKSRIEEQVKVPKNVDYKLLIYLKAILIARLTSHVSITKALYGNHSVNILTKPVFELREIDDLGLFLVAMMMIETIEEVSA